MIRTRSSGLAIAGALVLGAGAIDVRVVRAAQESSAPENTARASTAYEATRPRIVYNVDIQARFDAFEREMAQEFGFELAEAPGERREPAIGDRLEERFAGSAIYRWYDRLAGVYDRFEGIYERIEMSTRWARSGFEVDPDVERVFDGKLGLQIEREIGGFDMGIAVDDAIDGRFGLRLGGEVRGYKVSFDVSDIVESGRFGFRLRRSVR